MSDIPSLLSDDEDSPQEPIFMVSSEQSIPLLMISQLLASNCEGFGPQVIIGANIFRQYGILGVIKHITFEQGCVTFKITDGTGVLDVFFIPDDNEDIPAGIGEYVFAVGRLQTKRNDIMNAFFIRPVTDFNQIAFHAIQASFIGAFKQKIGKKPKTYQRAITDFLVKKVGSEIINLQLESMKIETLA